MAAAKTKLPLLSEKFNVGMRNGLRARLVEMDDEIEIFLLALAAKVHAFFLGKPGIAKSLLVETGIQMIDDLEPDDYFHTLMTKSTTREDLFGPLMLSLLKQDRYKYQPKGFMPVAKIVNLEEAWKGSAAVLNSLLWFANERKWRNDGEVLTVDLHSMFISSNEMPEGDELMAIYDRFLLRKSVDGIVEPGNLIAMFKLADAPVDKIVTWAEVEQAHKEVEAVGVPEDVLEALVEVKEKLKEKSILPSDRRLKQGLQVVRAKAWLRGQTQADIQDLRSLRHVLWNDPEEFTEVDKLVTGLSNPTDLEIMAIMKDVAGLSTALDKEIADPGDADKVKQHCTQLFDKVEMAMEELSKIDTRLKDSQRRSEQLGPAKAQVMTFMNRLLTKGFKMSPEEVAASKLTEFADVEEDDDE